MTDLMEVLISADIHARFKCEEVRCMRTQFTVRLLMDGTTTLD